MNILVWAVLGLVMLAIVVWAFRDAQVRMGQTVKSEVREEPPVELKRR